MVRVKVVVPRSELSQLQHHQHGQFFRLALETRWSAVFELALPCEAWRAGYMPELGQRLAMPKTLRPRAASSSPQKKAPATGRVITCGKPARDHSGSTIAPVFCLQLA